MKYRMELKPKATAKLNLKKVIIYTILGGSILSVLIYFGGTFFGVLGNPNDVMAAQVTGYTWEATITVDQTKVSGQNNLIDFPMLVKVIHPNLKDITNGGGVENINGFDIVFADMNNDQLDHQLESYDPIMGEYIAWIRVPNLQANNNTQIKMFYGNATVATDPSTENVWNTNYEGVWHMHNDPTNTLLDDAAGNYDAESFGGMNTNNLIAGKVGPGMTFDGANDYYAIKNKKFNTSGAIPTLTVTGWFKTTFYNNNYAANWSMLDFDRSEYFNVFIHGKGKIGFSTRGSGSGSAIDDFYAGSYGEYNDGNWHHVAAVYDGTNKYIYVDGVLSATKNNVHNGLPIGSGNFQRYGFIGDGSEASTFNGNRNNIHYDGQYDEIRLLNTNLSADWIATEYENQHSPSQFITVVFNSSPLPVELSNFEVALIENYVQVSWITESEINNDYFTVEKSIDAINYDAIGEVTGAGNSNGALNYDYVDYDVNDGVTYYRLKQTDFNGKFEYFPPKAVNSQSAHDDLLIKTIKPSIVDRYFIMEIESKSAGIANVLITNMNGVQLFSVQIEIQKGITTYNFDKGDQLSSGAYIVNLVQDGKKPQSSKIIKR